MTSIVPVRRISIQPPLPPSSRLFNTALFLLCTWVSYPTVHSFHSFSSTSNADPIMSAYPPESVDKLLHHLGIANLANAQIIDLGSGTGKFTELLVARPEKFEVVAIEPHEGMRGALLKKQLGVKVLEGNAIDMPLEDGWGDALVAAQVNSSNRDGFNNV